MANVAPWALVSAVSVVFALALLVFHGRVATNTFRFLGLVALHRIADCLNIFARAVELRGIKLLLLLGVGGRHPFDPPAWNTVISFGALLVFGSLFFARAAFASHPLHLHMPAQLTNRTTYFC